MIDRYFEGFVFFVLPFIVDVVLLTVGGLVAGKRLLALIVALVYLSANIALPTFLLMGREGGVPWLAKTSA